MSRRALRERYVRTFSPSLNSLLVRQRIDVSTLNPCTHLMPIAKKKDQQASKRTKNDSNKTLEHFFNKAGPSKNGRSCPDSGRSVLKPRPHNALSLNSSEVIIVDSDDETEVPVARTGTRKRKLSEDSDIEVVWVHPPPTKQTPVITGRTLSDPVLKSTPNAKVAANMSASASFTFGTPSLLSNPTSDFKSHPMSFGNAVGLGFTGSTSNITPAPGPSAVNSAKDVGVESDNIHIDIGLSEGNSDEWLMGDDETSGTYVKGDEDDDDVEFVEDVFLGNNTLKCDISFCPCCQHPLHGLQPDVGIHLNVICSHLFTI